MDETTNNGLAEAVTPGCACPCCERRRAQVREANARYARDRAVQMKVAKAIDGECAVGGCHDDAAPERTQCELHLAKARERYRAKKAARRAT